MLGVSKECKGIFKAQRKVLYVMVHSGSIVPYFTVEAPIQISAHPIFGEKSCEGLIALELAPTVNYWFKG